MRYAIVSLILTIGLVSIVRADTADDDMAFQKNLDLLHVQMKIRVLSVMRDNDFFVPKTLLKKYLDQQDALCKELNGASALEIDATMDWASEVEKEKKDEADTMEKAAEDFGRKYLGDLTAGAKDPEAKDKDKGILTVWREYNLKMAEWNKKDKKSALEIARYVEGVAATLNASKAGGVDVQKEWHATVNQIYRGAIKDTNNMVQGIVNLEKERIYYDGCLQAMKRVQDTLKVIEFVRDDKSFWEGMAEKTRDQVAKYLQEKYANGVKEDEEMVKWGVDKVYGVLKNAKGAWDKCGDLDKDPILAENPTALAMCKRMAAFTALYDSVLDYAKDLTVVAPFKPLFSILEYYSKGMGLVEPFARAMQQFYNQVSQGYKGFEKLSTWGELMDKDLGPFWSSALGKHYGLQIASGHDQWEGANLKYYMVVPKTVMERGYYTIGKEQYDRLAEAMSAERIIVARSEASRSVGVWVTENIFDKSTNVSMPSYIAAMKDKARKSPYLAKGKEKDVLALAQGLPVTFNEKEVTAQWLVDRLDVELDLMATELTVRAGSPIFSSDSMKRWEKFKELIKTEKVSLAPDQIVKLFSHFETGGGQDEQVRKFLRGVANQRKWRKLGIARVGVPLVTSDSPNRKVSPFSNVNLTALVIVSGLAPKREIDAEVTWQLPDWAGGPRKEQVKLKNGLSRLSCNMKAPVEIPRKPFDVKVTVKIPVGEGEEEAMEGSMSFQPTSRGPGLEMHEVAETDAGKISKPILPLGLMFMGMVDAQPPPAKPGAEKPKFREFTGSGTFGVEVVPFKISTVRCANYNATGIDITSDDLAALEFKPGDNNPTGLKFVLYRAVSAEGPFDKACGEMTVFPNKNDKEYLSKPADSDAVQGRMAKNVWRMADMQSAPPDAPRKPWFYQVGQQSVAGLGKVLSKEVRSNVAAPSGKMVLVVRGVSSKEGVFPPATSPPPGYYSFPVSLSMPDQAYDAFNTHFTVTAGGWTGHFWAKSDQGRSAIANVMVPGKLDGMSVSITGEGEGMNGSASFTIPYDPRAAAEARATAQRILDEQDKRAKAQATGLEQMRAAVKRAENEAAAKANGAKFLHISYLLDVAKAELDLREFTEWNMPWTAADARAEAAKFNTDYAGWLLAHQEKAKIVLKWNEIKLARIKTARDFQAQIAAAPDARDDLKRDGPKELERLDQALKDTMLKNEEDVIHQTNFITDAAVYAGDTGALIGARQMQMSFWVQRKMMNNVNLIGVATRYADEVAMMTGSREGAASILEWANQMRISAAPPEQREAVMQSMRPQDAPAWWPPTRKYGTPDGKLKPEDIGGIGDKLQRGGPATQPGSGAEKQSQ